MYEIEALEQKWKQYRRKKNRPLYLFGLTLLLLFIGGFLFLKQEKFSIDITFMEKTFTKISKLITSDANSTTTIKNEMLLAPALTKLEVTKAVPKENNSSILIEESPNTTQEELPQILVDIPILDNNTPPQTYIPKQKVHLDIVQTSNTTAYKEVEKRFKDSKDPDDSLFLARSYYKYKKYKKASYWAWETNKLEPTLEEAMLIFIKSKVRLHQKNQALNILKTYIKRVDSIEAKKLLFLIESGKF